MLDKWHVIVGSKNSALLCRKTRSYGDHMTMTLAVRGWHAHNYPIVCTVMQLHPVLGLSTRFGACSWSEHIEVCFGEPETTILKEENGRRPIFFIFWLNEVP